METDRQPNSDLRSYIRGLPQVEDAGVSCPACGEWEWDKSYTIHTVTRLGGHGEMFGCGRCGTVGHSDAFLGGPTPRCPRCQMQLPELEVAAIKAGKSECPHCSTTPSSYDPATPGLEPAIADTLRRLVETQDWVVVQVDDAEYSGRLAFDVGGMGYVPVRVKGRRLIFSVEDIIAITLDRTSDGVRGYRIMVYADSVLSTADGNDADYRQPFPYDRAADDFERRGDRYTARLRGQEDGDD